MNATLSPQSDLVEEYFEAHSSSKVLTSDRTLQKLQTPKLDRVSDLEPPLRIMGSVRDLTQVFDCVL